MLTPEIVTKIHDFVYEKPRTITEIAEFLELNWRTADSYVEKIASEQGTIGTRLFRGGTRGALKIVFWNLGAKINSVHVQDALFSRISSGIKKSDFSPFDIYQYVDETKRGAVIVENARRKEMISALQAAKKQILFLSGNLSWINDSEGRVPLLKVIEETVQRGVSVKVLCRIDFPGIKNILLMQAINNQIGKDVIEIRHMEQPLRGFIVDSELEEGFFQLKETKNVQDFKAGEMDKNMTLSYTVQDKVWITWLSKVFWHSFRSAVPYEKRIKDLRSISKLL